MPQLTVVANNADPHIDLRPYVPCVGRDGSIAFQAAMRDGHSGVFSSDGASLATLASTLDGTLRSVDSHPVFTPTGVAFYATLSSGQTALCLTDHAALRTPGTAAPAPLSIGPLGPTANNAGTLAFRAATPSHHGIYILEGDLIIQLADTTGSFIRFHGLPVIDDSNAVVFRADLRDGRSGVFRVHDAITSTIAETGDNFTALARFPACTPTGRVLFCAERADDTPAIYASEGGRLTILLEAGDAFESFRGALPLPDGVLFYAVPMGGNLGIFTGPDPEHDKLIAIGDELFGASVSELALNPVSLNTHGLLALRVALSDGRQVILRADLSHDV